MLLFPRIVKKIKGATHKKTVTLDGTCKRGLSGLFTLHGMGPETGPGSMGSNIVCRNVHIALWAGMVKGTELVTYGLPTYCTIRIQYWRTHCNWLFPFSAQLPCTAMWRLLFPYPFPLPFLVAVWIYHYRLFGIQIAPMSGGRILEDWLSCEQLFDLMS